MIRIIDHQGNGYGAQAEITRRKGVNGEKSLSGVIYTNDEVLHGVDRGWKLEFEGELYAFTYALPRDNGNQIELNFDAVHEFFYDMSKSSQNNLLNDGSHTFRAYLDFIFADTPYNYSLDVDVRAFEKQSFGQRNRLDLFYDVIDTAGVEFSVNGSVVRIVERVGNDLSTVVKKGFNLNELRLEKNIGDFVTYQKGFGAWFDEEDHSQGRLEVEYTSPLAEIYGKLDADPIVDERYTVRDNLLARLQSNVEGSYQISVQIDMEDLTRAGYEYRQPHEGDSIMAINKDLGFQRKIRIVSYETDFDVEGNILDHRIICNSIGMVEQSIFGNASIKTAVQQLESDLAITRQHVTEARVAADGKSMNYYGPVEPSPDENKLSIGDTWFDSSGEETIIKVWNGVEWRKSGADVDAIRRQIQQAQADIEAERERVDTISEDITLAVDAAGFTDMADALTGIQSISNTAQQTASDAWNSAQTAISDAQTALGMATTAVSDVASIDVRVDEVEGTLELKADAQTVDALAGTVQTHGLDIQANAEGLALKANQDTVDTLAGTVSTLGTDIGVVAGQISSKVWNTDIESAIDGIEVGGRNLAYPIYDNYRTYGGNETSTVIQKLSENVYRTYLVKVEEDQSYIATQKGVGQNMRYFWFENNPIENLNSEVSIGGGYGAPYTLNVPLTPPAGANWIFVVATTNNDTHPVSEIKLEKGNKATDWTPAPEDTLARFDHIETEWEQTFNSFSQTVSSIDGRVTAQRQDIDSISGTVGNIEGDIATMELTISGLQTTVSNKAEQSQVTQLSNLIDARVTTDEMENAISVSEQGILAQTVLEGEVVARINQEADATLIENNRIYLAAETVAFSGEAIIPSAAIQSLSADKVNTGTLNAANVRIVNLDFNTAVGNQTEFIQTYWNSIDSSVQMTGDGFDLYIEGSHHGGLRAIHSEEESSRMGRYGKRSMSLYAGDNAFVSLSYQGGRTDGGEYNALSVLGATGEIEIFAPTTYLHGTLSMRNQILHFASSHTINTNPNTGRLEFRTGSSNNPLTFHGDLSGTRTLEIGSTITMNSTLNMGATLNMNGYFLNVSRMYVSSGGSGGGANYIDTSNGLRLVNQQGQISIWTYGSRSVEIGTGMQMHVPLNMNDNPIWNQSDRKLKTNIVDTKMNVLEDFFEVIQPVDYYWKDPSKNNSEQFGLIAQDTPIISDQFEGTWMLNSGKQTMVNTFGIKALYEEHQHVAQTVNSHTDTIHQLQSELSQASRKIEEQQMEIEELKGMVA